MNRDKNFERRMIVSKYSNRPPFDLKKPKGAYGILDKIKEYPVEGCRNCCRNMTKTSKNTLSEPTRNQISENFNDCDAPLGKKIIPKIIQTFQNLNLSQDADNLPGKKTSSIQTLYRNTRSCKLGKNIPKHKLMKSLLQNLDSEVDSCKKCSPELPFPSKGRLKYKKSATRKQFFDKDEVIRPDFTCSCENNNYSETSTKSAIANSRPPKIDKKTSTTGLTWPPGSKEALQNSNVLHRHQISRASFQKLNVHQPGTTSCSTIKEEALRSRIPQFSSNSFLEEAPTKDVPQNYHVEPTRSEKLLRKNVASRVQLRQKSLEDSTVLKKQTFQRNETFVVRPENFQKRSQDQLKTPGPEKLNSKEKSFVQTQVDKLNRVMKNTKIPVPKLNRQQNFNGKLQKREGESRECTGHGDYLRRNEATSNYMELMDRIKSNVPRIQKSDNYESFASGDDDWSDAGTEITLEHIRFPKETKTAVDQCLCEKKMRIPLSKFTKPHDNFRPAIPPREEDYGGYFEGLQDSKKQDDCNEPTGQPRERRNKNPRKNAPARPNLPMPCKKNLLCNKGGQHQGPCGCSYNRNKVVY